MSLQLSALSHKVTSSPSQIALSTSGLGIDVALWKVATSQQHGDLQRVLFIVLGLAAVDGLHGQRVTEYERELFGLAQIGQPVPVVSGLDAHNEISSSIGLERLEQILRLRLEVPMKHNFAIVPHDAHIHPLGVQIDTAVEFVLLGIEVHVHTP